MPTGCQYIAFPTKCIAGAENVYFLSSEQCAPGLWAHLFLREMCLLYFIFHFLITVQTVYCFHLAKFC